MRSFSGFNGGNLIDIYLNRDPELCNTFARALPGDGEAVTQMLALVVARNRVMQCVLETLSNVHPR